jgi:LAS superfamily LD-carboxypeptidase LdcB
LATPPGETESLSLAGAIAYTHMKNAAKKDGVPLSITSGFRTYEEQKHLWKCYQQKKKGHPKPCNTGNKAAYPGTSKHQKGDAIDINLRRDPKVLPWLKKHAKKFGFRQTYASGPWHWVYKDKALLPKQIQPKEPKKLKVS